MSGNAPAERILVLCVGNPLMGDEGVGPRCAEYLMKQYAFPDGVEVVDAGTMGFGILNMFQDVDFVIVVDAVQGTGHAAGTVVSLEPQDMAPNQILHSLHDARLTDVLDAATLMGLELEVTCIGVQVDEIVEWQLELSPVVEASIPFAATAVVEVLGTRGVSVQTNDAEAGRAARIIESLRTKDDLGS